MPANDRNMIWAFRLRRQALALRAELLRISPVPASILNAEGL